MTDYEKFTHSLLDWYKVNGRSDLPWRQDFDPYKVWVSEIMLQQTQVNRVAEKYYPRFLKTFPTLKDLANSNWEEVYTVWQGLGFYRRGKNMLKAAKIMQKKHDGKVPDNFQDLIVLPGIGVYTACAILSFAYNKPLAALDTNIHKIIGVLWPSQKPKDVANQLLKFADSPRDWNGAMMDLGTALRNKEELVGDIALFFSKDKRHLFLPSRTKAKKPKKKARKHTIEVGIGCIWQDKKYLIQTRPDNKSFPGFWEFPGGKREKGEDFRGCVKRELKEEIDVEVSVRPHFYEELLEFDHVNLLLRFHRCQIQQGEPKALEDQKIKWASPDDFDDIQFLKTNKKALEKIKNMKM